MKPLKVMYYLIMMWDETSDHMYEAAYIHELRTNMLQGQTYCSDLVFIPYTCTMSLQGPDPSHQARPQPHQIIYSLSQHRLIKYPIRDGKDQCKKKQTSKNALTFTTL